MLETASQFFVHVDPNEILANGRQFLNKPLRLYEPSIFKQSLLGELVSEMVLVLQALHLPDGRPPHRASLAGLTSQHVVEVVDIDADEVDEVAVYPREVLPEVPDDSVELGDQRAQLLANINDLPKVRLR